MKKGETEKERKEKKQRKTGEKIIYLVLRRNP